MMENVINVAELDQSLKQSSDQIFLIDLTRKEDFARNHIPGSVNIPAEDLRNRFAEIPKNKNIVVACRTGSTKSDNALRQLRESGFTNARKLTGGTAGWFQSFK